MNTTYPLTVSLADGARIIGVTPQTMSNWVRNGRIPHTSIGGIKRLHFTDVAAAVSMSPEQLLGVIRRSEISELVG